MGEKGGWDEEISCACPTNLLPQAFPLFSLVHAAYLRNCLLCSPLPSRPQLVLPLPLPLFPPKPTLPGTHHKPSQCPNPTPPP